MSLPVSNDLYNQLGPQALLLDEELGRLIKLRCINEKKQHFSCTESNFRLYSYLEHLDIGFQTLPNPSPELNQHSTETSLDASKDVDEFSGMIITGIIFTYADTDFISYTMRWRRDNNLYLVHDLAFGSAGDSDTPGRLLVQEVSRLCRSKNWYISIFQRGTWLR